MAPLLWGSGGSVGRWRTVQMTFKDESNWTFTPDPANPDRYLLTRIANLLGRYITVRYGPGDRLDRVEDDARFPTALLRFAYDAGGRLSTVRDLYGRQVRFTFGLAAGVTSLLAVSQVSLAGGWAPVQWQYSYAAVSGQPLLSGTSVPNPQGGTGLVSNRVLYDPASLQVGAMVDARGTRHDYDHTTHQVKVTGPSGMPGSGANTTISESWTQKLNGALDTAGTVNGLGHADSLLYEDAANPHSPTTLTNRSGQSAQVRYDADGNVVRTTAPVNGGHVSTQLTYDRSAFPLGRLVEARVLPPTPGGAQRTPTSISYFPNGLVASVSTPRPGTVATGQTVTTSYTYTALGNVATVTSPAPSSTPGATATTTFTYTLDPSDGYSKPEALGEPVCAEDANGNRFHWRYDQRGNVIATLDGEGIRTDYQYNLADQVVAVIHPSTGIGGGTGRARTLYTYAYVGGPLVAVRVFGEDGRLERTAGATLGAEGEPTRAQVGGLTTGSQTYDLHYRPGTLADGKAQASAFAWDKAGNLTALRYPGGGQMRFPSYDREGNLTLRVSGRQIRTRYLLAPDDSRLTDVLYGSPSYGTPDVHCEYDAYGRLTKAESRYPGAPVAEATLEYEYDDNDAVTKVSTSYADQFYATNDHYGPYDVSYTFFPDGSRASMVTPYGTYGYQYDAGGRLAQVSFPWTNGTCDYTYLHNDWLQREDSAGLRTSYVWNARGFLTSLTHSGPSGSPTFSSFSGMTYNAVGQRTHTDTTIPAFSGTFTSYPSASGTVDYEYDAQGRLTREHSVRDNAGVYGATFDRRYAWDGADNPTTLRNLSRSYNRDNQLVYAGRSYDGDGNTLVSGASYDAENRLLSTTLSGGNWWCGYRPDGLCGWRISGSLGGVYVVYDGAQPLYEVDLDGIVRWVYGWGASGLTQVSRADDEAFTYNLLFDPQGNLVQREPLYDETPAHPAEVWVYDAFGAWVAGTTAGVRDFEPMGFGGQFGCYADSDGVGWSGLVLMTYRFYEPWSGRFLTRDPISYDGGLNLYTYCGGDPVNRADPSGLQGHVLLEEAAETSAKRVAIQQGEQIAVRVGAQQAAGFALANCLPVIGQVYDVAWVLVQGYAIYEDVRWSRVSAACAQPAPGFARAYVRSKLRLALTMHNTKANMDVSRVVIGKLKDLANGGHRRTGELAFEFAPDRGAEKLNWERNAAALLALMDLRLPMRDVSAEAHGFADTNTGFLRCERLFLEDHGWRLDPKTHYWMPPGRKPRR